jgi:hypothetical protein
MGVCYALANKKTREYIDLDKGSIYRSMFDEFRDSNIDTSMFGEYFIENSAFTDENYTKFVARNIQIFIDSIDDPYDIILKADDIISYSDGKWECVDEQEIPFYWYDSNWKCIWNRCLDSNGKLFELTGEEYIGN